MGNCCSAPTGCRFGLRGELWGDTEPLTNLMRDFVALHCVVDPGRHVMATEFVGAFFTFARARPTSCDVDMTWLSVSQMAALHLKLLKLVVPEVRQSGFVSIHECGKRVSNPFAHVAIVGVELRSFPVRDL